MAETVDLLILPGVQPEKDVDDVKAKLVKTLRVQTATVDRWFSIDTPSRILRDVSAEVAHRYVKAIMRCGARCITRPAEKSNRPMISERVNENSKLSACPSCGYEVSVAFGDELDECPKCGLDIAKWVQRVSEEAETEKIRRRLQRAAKLSDDSQEKIDAKRKELERLRALEREIVNDLGFKSSGALWLFYEKYPITLSFAISFLIVIATVVAFYYVDDYLDQQQRQVLVEDTPSEEIQEIALIVGAAVQLQQSGNEKLLEEMAEITQVMRGQDSAARTAVVKAAQRMMNGADSDKFIAIAAKMQQPTPRAKPMPGDPGSIPVNIDTIGGVTGLTGLEIFDQQVLSAISPSTFHAGYEGLLRILTKTQRIRDPANPAGPHIVVEAINEMDGSMILGLMNSLVQDLEWDQFLFAQVRRYLANQDYKRASELTNRIRNPVVKIESLTEIMNSYLLSGNQAPIKPEMVKVLLALDEIKDPDVKARTLLAVGESMAAAGSKAEPEDSISRLETMASASTILYERSMLHGRLAVAYMHKVNKGKTRLHFSLAIRAAGQIAEPGDRLSAFTRIAQRYFDVRNTTLANEILNEAEVLAAIQLDPEVRARVFGEIAIARGYLGDFIGANMAIDNAARGEGKQQLLSKLAEMLIDNRRYFQAMAIMDSLVNDVDYSRLGSRVISSLVHSDRQREGEQLLALVIPRVQRIFDPSVRGLMLSQLARLAARTGNMIQSEVLFVEAIAVSDVLKDIKAQVNRSLVALNRARVFQFAHSRDVMGLVSNITVKDPIGNEILATERTITLLLPDLLPVK